MAVQPNFLFIFMDDMGWRDLACTGSTFYETPNIDRLCSICQFLRVLPGLLSVESQLFNRTVSGQAGCDGLDRYGRDLSPLEGKTH